MQSVGSLHKSDSERAGADRYRSVRFGDGADAVSDHPPVPADTIRWIWMKSLRGSGRRGCNGICTEFSVYVDYPLFVFPPLCSILSGRKAKWVNAAVIVIIGGMSAAVLGFVRWGPGRNMSIQWAFSRLGK